MKKILFYLLLLLSFVSCRSIESSSVKKIGEKELFISFYNVTDFTVDILEGNPDSMSPVLHVEPKQSNTITKKIHAADDISLFFYSRFYIPVGDTYIPITNYKDIRVETKNGLHQTSNIGIINKLSQNTPYYVVLKNNADKEISIYNSSAKSYYLTINKTKTIIPNCEGIYSSKDREFFSIQHTISMQLVCSNKVFDFPISQLQSGFVYTYSFDGKRIIKEDERPLIKINEPLWSSTSTDIYVSKIISGMDHEQFYIIGKEKNSDKYGNVYESAYISSKDSYGTEKWKCLFTENNCDTSFYNATVMEDASILAVGTHTKELHTGLIALYSQNGILLQSKKIEDCVLIESAVKIDKNNYILTGFNLQGALVILSLTIEKNTFNCNHLSYSIPLSGNEAVSKVIPFYDELSKKLLLFCNLFDLETEQALPSIIYAVSEDSKIERISLQNTIKEISTVLRDSTGHFYLGGETIEREQSAAVVVHLDYINNKPTVFYTDGSPYSYISTLHLNKKSHELIISGTLKAADSFGNEGSPFIKSLSIDLGKELWATVYQDKDYELLSSFIPCEDYGFIAVFTQVNEEGAYTAPFCIARTNAIGAVSK